jgi:hypothetical protein
MAKRKANSLARYSLCAKKDTCLHDDVEYFLSKHETGLSRLVDMLLHNDFESHRFSDPSYPA